MNLKEFQHIELEKAPRLNFLNFIYPLSRKLKMAPTTATAAPKKVVAKAPTAAAAAPATPAADATATEKKVVKKVVKKAETAAPEAVAAPAPVVAAPAPVAAATEATASPVVEGGAAAEAATSNTEALFSKLIAQFNELQGEMKTLQTNLRVLQKEVLREQKEAKKVIEKSQKKKRVQDPSKPRPLSGIAKAAPISNELCDFLEVPHGTQLSRIDVIKKINAYITANNLKNPADKKTFLPDAKLRKLISSAEGEVVALFGFQSRLKNHFPKATVAAPAATA